MAFKKKTWVDRMVEYAGRRKITNVTTMAAQIVDVERAEGVVSEEGTAINAVNMNDFEQRTADAFSAVQQDIEGINSDLDECTFERREDGAYITYTPPGGADPVQKKLGSPSDAEREDITASLAIKAVGSPNSHTVTASIDFNYDLIYLFVRATAASVTDITAYAGSPVILDTIPCPKSGGLYTIVAKNMTEGTAIRIAHNAGTGELQIIAIGMRQ